MRHRIAIVLTVVLAVLVPAASMRAQPPGGRRPPLEGGVTTTEPRAEPRPAAPKTFEEIPARYREGFDIFQRALDFTRKAYATPSLVDTSEWKGLTGRLETAVERYEPLQDCLCPMSGALVGIKHWWDLRNDRIHTEAHRQQALEAAARSIEQTADCLRAKKAEAPALSPVLQMAEEHRRRTDQAAGRPAPPERNPLDRFLFPDARGQNPPPQEPFKLGISATEIPPEGPGTVLLSDGTQLDIVVDKGGGAPKEPGVDWDGWYKAWIAVVAEQVHEPVEKRFAGDSHRYETTQRYRVYPDGRLVLPRPGYWTDYVVKGQFQTNHRDTVTSFMTRIKAPPFPAGAKLPYVDRTFTFSHNTRPAGITLGGPPREPAVKTR